MKKRNLSLKKKILIPVVALLVVSITIILAITLGISASSMDTLSNSVMEEKNLHYASEVQGMINASMNSVESLELLVSQFVQQGGHNREKVIAILKNSMLSDDAVFSTYTLWEPNAFDGNDIAYVNKTGYDSTGRFIPYVARGDSSLYVEALVDYETEGVGDYYLLPKKTGKACVLNPFLYETNGKQMFMTSMVVPIFSNGKFVGIVGQDILIDTLIANIKDTKIFDSGYLFLIDSTGNLFFHPNGDVIGTPVFDYLDASAAARLKNGMAAGTTVTFDSGSTLKNFESRYVISPVTIGDTQWWVGSTAPVKEITKTTVHSVLYGAIAGILSCILIAFILIRLISRALRPISGLVEVADRLAQGDVNVNVEATTTDEIGTLMHAFGKMIASIREQASAAEKIAAGDLTTQVSVRSEGDLLGKKLSEMIQMNNDMLASIYSAADQVAAGAKQISDSSISLSRGAIEQASSIEELTASMEEISGQTRQNAEHANQANTLAEAVKASAERGNLQMGNMLKAMQDINDSSVQIANIIKVIEGIAFQTNILALNAAVEAARAGEHGKGFAVVADEVRNLAARSAQAAQETTEMIEGSVRKVEDGTRIANETAGALHEIVQGIENVAGLVSGIASASTQQTQGIEQINQGIMQVSQVVQTNSATSEEGAAASEELASQAELLKDHVGHFKLKKSENVSL